MSYKEKMVKVIEQTLNNLDYAQVTNRLKSEIIFDTLQHQLQSSYVIGTNLTYVKGSDHESN